MAVPQNKISPSRRNKRRSHDAIFADMSIECPNCGELVRRHHVCLLCGHYGNREIARIELVVDEEDE